MIEFLSSWAKGLGLAIVIVSILEMLLPNNKTKKYIRTILGIYVLFTIISPFIKNKDKLDFNNINLEDYMSEQTSTIVDQSSMDKRIEELYIQELEKDIKKKLEEKGYQISSCKVKATISDSEENTKITKIKLSATKSEVKKEEDLENKIVTEIQKIKPIDTTIRSNDTTLKNENSNKLKQADIQNIKKFLIEEYGVNEKCLEIN